MNSQPKPWPTWRRRLVTVALIAHLAAMLAIALSGNPASDVERRAAQMFGPYAEFTGLASVHRYYAPAPPPTPVVTAEIVLDGARTSEFLRLPDRAIRPRLRYQRQLALAYHLFNDFQRAAHAEAARPPSIWAASYARHLFATNPRARSIVLRVQQHLVPDPAALAELRRRGVRLDPDDAQFYTVPELIGAYERPRSDSIDGGAAR